MSKHTIRLSDGRSYEAELVVYRDYVGSNGLWRLFWREPGTSCGVEEQSTVCGRPHFRTMRAAVAYGQERYGIRAKRAEF